MRELRKAQANAKECKETFLDKLAEMAATEQKKDKKSIIQQIKSTEKARSIALKVKTSLKRTQRGGIHHFEVPTERSNYWRVITDKQEIHNALLTTNKEQYQKAGCLSLATRLWRIKLKNGASLYADRIPDREEPIPDSTPVAVRR